MTDLAQTLEYKTAPRVPKAQPGIESLRQLALARMSELDDGRVRTLDFGAEMQRIRTTLSSK